MKNLFLIAFLFAFSLGFAQETTGPVWPGCENSEDPKACFNQKLMEHVQNNYEYPQTDDGDYVRGKVTMKLAINEKGEVVLESIKGDEPQVTQAATTMVEKMPKMEPGTLDGEPRKVSYTIPLTL